VPERCPRASSRPALRSDETPSRRSASGAMPHLPALRGRVAPGAADEDELRPGNEEVCPRCARLALGPAASVRVRALDVAAAARLLDGAAASELAAAAAGGAGGGRGAVKRRRSQLPAASRWCKRRSRRSATCTRQRPPSRGSCAVTSSVPVPSRARPRRVRGMSIGAPRRQAGKHPARRELARAARRHGVRQGDAAARRRATH
jgi:hypothetical protein